jgi:hypothetical protein
MDLRTQPRVTLARRFGDCMRDERGIAMTEYLLIVGLLLPLIFYLYNPNNGFYQRARMQFEATKLMLVLPCDEIPL